MVFMLERDFREICFALMPGSWHWRRWSRAVDGLDGQRLDVQGGSAGARLPREAEGEHQGLHVPLLAGGWTQALLRGAWQKDRTRPCGSLHHGKFWLSRRGNKIPKKMVKHWSRESGSLTSLEVWDLDRMRPWATWSGGICAEEEAGLNDLQRCLPT